MRIFRNWTIDAQLSLGNDKQQKAPEERPDGARRLSSWGGKKVNLPEVSGLGYVRWPRREAQFEKLAEGPTWVAWWVSVGSQWGGADVKLEEESGWRCTQSIFRPPTPGRKWLLLHWLEEKGLLGYGKTKEISKASVMGPCQHNKRPWT